MPKAKKPPLPPGEYVADINTVHTFVVPGTQQRGFTLDLRIRTPTGPRKMLHTLRSNNERVLR
jgi:hypothetical protein